MDEATLESFEHVATELAAARGAIMNAERALLKAVIAQDDERTHVLDIMERLYVDPYVQGGEADGES